MEAGALCRRGERGNRGALRTLAGVGASLVCALLALGVPSRPAAAATGSYIVVLEPGADPAAVARDHGRRYGVEPSFVYRSAISGYAGRIPAARLEALRASEAVAYVERDGEARPAAQTLPWGINRIDADVSSTLAGNGSGSVGGVNAYVIDTGIDTAHADLNVVRHVTFVRGKNRDCHGHGTHVAGTLGARDNSADVVGAAPGLPLTGVKVMNCSGNGSTSGVIKAVDWVTANAVRPAVANMSLTTPTSRALDDAVRNSAASGIPYAVAAGNHATDACDYSPARAGAGTSNGILTTAATDSANRETSWSDFGPCVDIWAPGDGILSTRRGGGTATMSGTSMSSPHVAGTAALYLFSHPSAGAASVESQLRADATAPGTTSKSGAAIRLLYAGGY